MDLQALLYVPGSFALLALAWRLDNGLGRKLRRQLAAPGDRFVRLSHEKNVE